VLLSRGGSPRYSSLVLRPLIAAVCVTFVSAAVLNPDATHLVLVAAALAVAVVVVASSTTVGAVGIVRSNVLAGTSDPWPGPSGFGSTRGVVHLVLLSQPRR
jgi:hypothetical protein